MHLAAAAVAALALAADLPVGQVVPDVVCAADASQSYALYLPSAYTAMKAWPVIFAFDPGARGRVPVERYQAAAERYGFIVAGSNNSRNGSAENGKAIVAMTGDVLSRFSVDERRIYLAGMSGGSRVALGVALGSPKDRVAGVIASSAGYPDGKVRKTLPFPIFATAGTEDFNHLEMRQLDRALTSPHRLAIFDGGHVWLSSDLAIEAVEWMELQAMKTGLKARDEAEIDRMFAKRQAAVDASKTDKDTFLALQAIADDFDRLRDVHAIAARAAELGRDKNVRAALKRDRDEDDREESMLEEIRIAEARLGSSAEDRSDALLQLRRRWKDLSDAAHAADDSPARRLARRVLAGLSAGVTTTDQDYLRIINQYRPARPGRP
jgi:poly(3-hydroxybutyrate) depolymerase